MFRRIAPNTFRMMRLAVRSRWLVGLAFAIPSVQPVALAGQQTTQPDLVRAIEAYDAGELQRSLSLLEATPALLGPHDSAVRSLYTGLVQYALGETVAARLSFARAVRTEPSIDLDPAIHSPSRVEAFQQAKSDVVAELRSAALEADRDGDETTALERWRVVLLAVPDDLQATRRIGAIEADRQRRAAQAARDTATTTPPPVPAEGPAETDASRRLNPGQAFAMGLIVPGLGQFYTGRATRGVLALGTAGGLIAAGILSERLEIECGSVPVDDTCPTADILDQRTRRPYLAPAIAVAAGIAIVGAIDAMIAARRSNAESPAIGTDNGSSPRLLAPGFTSENGVLHAELLRIRFR